MIYIQPHVCTKCYELNNNSSVSFITDLNNKNDYVIYGDISKLWNSIIKLRYYDSILSFAKKNNLENILNGFLFELKKNNIIATKNKYDNINSNLMSFKINRNAKNFHYFETKKKNLLIYNNYLCDVALNLNYRCNLNCKHCCNNKDMFQFEINIDSAKKIINEAYDLGVYSVTLTGGEATINKDFFQIAKYVREKFLELNILTNGQQLYDDKFLFKNIISIFPAKVQLSLYSMNPEIHDNITGVKGSHFKTLSVIKELKLNKINTTISCFQTSYNPLSFIEVKNFAESMEMEFLSDCRFHYNPKNNNLNAKLSKQQIEKYYIETLDMNNLRNGCLNCYGGIDRIAVMPNLDVNPCNYCYYILGNLKNISLKEIKETKVKEFQNKLKPENLKDCFKHYYCKYCMYCPIYSCYLEDGFLKKSDILCEDAQAYKNAVLYRKKHIF